jgi:hypothetical protein
MISERMSIARLSEEIDELREYIEGRELVGLTDEEINTLYATATNQELRPQDKILAFAFARAIEAKLKEKNHECIH